MKKETRGKIGDFFSFREEKFQAPNSKFQKQTTNKLAQSYK
jgi:hypothetical protein